MLKENLFAVLLQYGLEPFQGSSLNNLGFVLATM